MIGFNNSNHQINFQEIEEIQSTRNLFEILIDESEHLSNEESWPSSISSYDYSMVESTDEQTNEFKMISETGQEGNRKAIYIIASNKRPQTRKCGCVKTECRKNYCPCHRNGRKCSLLCNCTDCDNKKERFYLKTTIENFWQYSHLFRQ